MLCDLISASQYGGDYDEERRGGVGEYCLPVGRYRTQICRHRFMSTLNLGRSSNRPLLSIRFWSRVKE